MIEHMERTLIRVGFLDADHPKGIMRVLRRLFGRSQMDHHLRNQEKPLNKNPLPESSVKGVDGIHLKIKISFGADLTTSLKRV